MVLGYKNAESGIVKNGSLTTYDSDAIKAIAMDTGCLYLDAFISANSQICDRLSVTAYHLPKYLTKNPRFQSIGYESSKIPHISSLTVKYLRVRGYRSEFRASLRESVLSVTFPGCHDCD